MIAELSPSVVLTLTIFDEIKIKTISDISAVNCLLLTYSAGQYINLVSNIKQVQWRIQGGRPWRAPPYGPKFSQFHVVFWKIWQNHILVPPSWGVGTPS